MSDRVRNLSPKHSIRSRLAILGTLLLFGCFAIGGVAFDRLLTQQLNDNLDLRLSEQATERAAAVTAGLDPSTQLETIQQETAVAVFDDAAVLLAARGFGDIGQVADLASGSNQTLELLLIENGENEIESSQLRVAVRTVADITVVVASEATEVEDPVNEVRRLLMIGIPEESRISFPMDKIRKKELCLQNVRRQNKFVKPAIDFIASGNETQFMITHTFPLEEAGKAFNLVDGYRDGVVKAMIKIG